ncbi:hypothetical protein NI18_11200 [Sphingomonas sp. Ant20]|nr:hypothetical protein NI18_11200 [Sphingomonas sp. Ant20]
MKNLDIDTLVKAEFAQPACLRACQSGPVDRSDDAMLLAGQRFETDGTIGASVHDATDYQ